MYKPIRRKSATGDLEAEARHGITSEPAHFNTVQVGAPNTVSREHFLNQPLTPTNILSLQKTVGNRNVQRLLARRSNAPVIQRQTKSKNALEILVKNFEAKKNEVSSLYFKRFYKENTGLDEDDQTIIENFAWGYWDFKDAKEEVEKKEVEKKKEEKNPADVVKGVGFVSLQNDVERGFYTVTAEASTKIRKSSGEAPFAGTYSGGKSVTDAVGEAVAGLDLTGSVSFQHSRHDFQPSNNKVVNLQIQLGGSAGNYRKRKGDTSSTVVVIEAKLWDNMVKADAARWKQVIQAAHRQSFNGTQRIEINPA